MRAGRSLILIGALLGAGTARAETFAVSTTDCSQLVTHTPRPDVKYKPGVDVHGKPVVPADLGGGYAINLPESVDIQIGVNLAHTLGVPQTTDATRKPYSGYAPLGTLSIKGNDAFWNGKPIAPQDQAALAEACRDSLTAAGVTLPTEKPAAPLK